MTAETEKPATKASVTSPAEARRTPGWAHVFLRVLMLVAAFLALVAFSAVLAELTLTPSPASAGIAGSNLRPGHSLRQYLDDYTFLAACKQIGGNVVMGMPFGLILPVLVPSRMRMVRVLVLTTVVMVLIELAQGALVEGRAFDIDDVILNTGGALIAYVVLGRRIGHKYHTLGEPRAPKARRRAAGATDEARGGAVEGRAAGAAGFAGWRTRATQVWAKRMPTRSPGGRPVGRTAGAKVPAKVNAKAPVKAQGKTRAKTKAPVKAEKASGPGLLKRIPAPRGKPEPETRLRGIVERLRRH
jgi:glycopeptide antibiotics resistance protein